MKKLLFLLSVTLISCTVEESDIDIIEQMEQEIQQLEAQVNTQSQTSNTGTESSTSSSTENTSGSNTNSTGTESTNTTTNNTSSNTNSTQSYSSASHEYADVTEFPTRGINERILVHPSNHHSNGEVLSKTWGITYNTAGYFTDKEGDVYFTSDRFGEETSARYLNSYQCETYLEKYMPHLYDVFTISLWTARLGDGCDNPTLVSFNRTFNSDSMLDVIWNNSESLYGSDISEGEWFNIILSFTAEGINVYIKGEFVTTLDPLTERVKYIGFGNSRNRGGHAFNGVFDDVAIWDRELNHKEIEWLANN